MKLDSSPIAAIATAPGRGGIGVVRASGKNLAPLMTALFGAQQLKPRHATYLPFTDGDGAIIDQGIALHFKGPHSYTGEDVLELQGHGGPVVLQLLLARVLEAGRDSGLRLAEPGEFTRRAFLNDKLDLAQAEAVADLIDASTEAAAKSASQSLSGAFSNTIHALVEQVTGLRMLVEATLDFPEEEIDFLEKSNARGQLKAVIEALNKVFAQAAQGALLREGLNVVLAGQPNVGKSSLLNALAGADVAIVTPIAGTTRDKVVQQIVIDGVALHIVDTAGLRETDDTVERLGIERTWAEIAKADVIIHLQDATAQTEALDEDIARRLPPRTPVFQVFNKVDLLEAGAFDLSTWGTTAAAGLDARLSESGEGAGVTRLAISARTGDGLDALRQALLAVAGWNPGAESPYLARERHLQALLKAQDHLDEADAHAAQSDRVLDLFAEELRLAHDALTSITGAFTSDDLLGVIFSRFCIGK